MTFLKGRLGLQRALRILACAAGVALLYVAGYAVLMRRDLPAVDEAGRFAYRSSFWFAPSVRVGPPTAVYPAVSLWNVFFEPVDNGWRSLCGFIRATAENEPFAAGELDPGRITAIAVFFDPPGMGWADRYVDLARCRRVEVDSKDAARELCQALSAGHSARSRGIEGETVTGTIRAVVDGDKDVYLYFSIVGNSEVYVCHPGRPAQDPGVNGHGQNALLPWLRKHALQVLAPRER